MAGKIVMPPKTPGTKRPFAQRANVSGQRAQLALTKATTATDPAMKTKFLNRARRFGMRGQRFTNRAAGL